MKNIKKKLCFLVLGSEAKLKIFCLWRVKSYSDIIIMVKKYVTAKKGLQQ